MKNTLPIVCLLVAAYPTLIAQNPELISYPIGNTGYSVSFPANPGDPEISLSDNELEVYTYEVNFNECLYGMQLVLLEDKFTHSDSEMLENLLTSYMQFLKLSFDITSSIGYIKGQKLAGSPRVSGVMDFWEDERGAQWAVKGWVSNNALTVLYVHCKKAENMTIPYEFLDGFCFPKEEKKQPDIYFNSKKNVK